MNLVAKTVLAGTVTLLLIQLVPYGRDHKNPPIISEPVWSSPEVRGLAKKACFNCHSHETVWPFYTAIAPASWLVYYDVIAARKKLNFSAWQGGKRAGEDPTAVAQEITKGEMPPLRYAIAHPEAKLTADEKKKLIEGIMATFGQSIK